MTVYTIYSKVDYQDYGSFETRKEAQERIKELKRFDKEYGNPFRFQEHYFIEVEEYEY